MGKKQKYQTIFEDKDVLINEHQIKIKCYYFPIAKSKTVPFSQIKKIQFGKLSVLGGSGRLWGMSVGSWGYWFAGDIKRLQRTHYIAIHRGSSIIPTFTSEKIDQIYKLLTKLWEKSKNTNQLQQKQEQLIQKQKE